jgi:hypothetical protein
VCSKFKQDSWSNKNAIACGASYTAEYDVNENITVRANYNRFESQHFQYTTATDIIQLGSSDVNLGVNWHRGNWGANLEGHLIHGGRNVNTTDFAANPTDYKDFFVIATNLVYFFD